MNEYLKERMGINLTEEVIIANRNWLIELEKTYEKEKQNKNTLVDLDMLYESIVIIRRQIEEAKEWIKISKKNILEKSVINIEVLYIIKNIIEDFYQVQYKLIPIKINKSNNKTTYQFLLVSDNITTIPNYEENQFWDFVENKNIIILASSIPKCNSLENITKVSFNNKNFDKEALTFNKGSIQNLDEELKEIINLFINELIIYKCKINKDTLTLEEMQKIYNKVSKKETSKRKVLKNN